MFGLTLQRLALLAGLGVATCHAAATEIILIGDSTVASYGPKLAPITGYGQPLNLFFNKQVVVNDQGKPGRSSKTYFDEGWWTPIKTQKINKGDYVFIEFGHNDQTYHATQPNTTYKDLLRMYVKDTRAAGGNPVLLTSITRCISDAKGKFSNSIGDYPAATRALAKEMHVPLVDLNRLSIDELNRVGVAKAQSYYMFFGKGIYPAYPKGSADHVHLQYAGAHRFAQLIAQELKKIKHPLAKYLK